MAVLSQQKASIWPQRVIMLKRCCRLLLAKLEFTRIRVEKKKNVPQLAGSFFFPFFFFLSSFSPYLATLSN